VVLRKRGEELIGLCPFHEDHDPSLVVNPEKNLWHCLGACQAGGSVIDWVMKAEGVSFRHAVELLRKDYSPLGVTSAISQKVSKMSTVTKLKSVVTKDGDEQERLRQVLNYYTESLKQSPEALDYLAKRGIDSGDAIELFRLGYSNRTLGYHIPFKNRREGKEVRGHLEKLGIYRKSGHEHFRGSLVIPVSDENGVVTEVYGRKIGGQLRKGTPLHLYLPGPHRGVWNIEAFKASTEVILCESLIDALTFWCAGYRNVTASYGIEGFTKDHLEAFKRYEIERVLIAYDRDEAGEKAASSLAAKLMAEGMECFRIQFPNGMDANEYALSLKPAEKSLGVVIRKAVWLGKGERPEIRSTSVDCETPVEHESSSSVGAVPLCPPEDAGQDDLQRRGQ
jgi:DNA primase catalytic core